MLIIPAVDIKNGRCARLFKGREDMPFFYSITPVQAAVFWENQGAERLHVVDLDGAFRGSPVHFELIREIIKTVKIPVQVGGGIRSAKDVERFLSAGASNVVLSTMVVEDIGLFREVVRAFPGHIFLSVDVKKGRMGIDGWKRLSETDPRFLIRVTEDLPLAGYIFTNIERDGTLKGIDRKVIEKYMKGVGKDVFVAGGISNYEDIEMLKKIKSPEIKGAIIGKALYDGRIEFKTLLTISR